MKFSVIMMCHNSEKYIKRAIDSLKMQTEKDWELIIVDDASADDTYDYIKGMKSWRIKYYAVDFDSVGKTINFAINMAKGEYISVLDPDDSYPFERLEMMYPTSEYGKPDIVKGGWTEINGDKRTHKELSRDIVKFKPIDLPLEEKMEYFGIMPVWWNAIYRREFLIKNNIKAHETDGAAYQDNAWVFQANMRANEVMLIPGTWYNYSLDNPTSSTHSSRYPMSIYTEFHWITEMLEDDPYLNFKLRRILEKLRFTSYFWNLRRISEEDREEWKSFMQREFMRNWEYQDCRLYTEPEWNVLKLAMENPENIIVKE